MTVEAFCSAMPTVEAFCAPTPAKAGHDLPAVDVRGVPHMDKFDAVEVMSSASTQLPASSIGTSFARGRFNSDITDCVGVRVPLSLDSFVNAPSATAPLTQDMCNRTTLMF